MLKKEFISPIWSAAPTPLLNNGELDVESLKRLTEHHYKMGIRGVFIGGTTGEGPFLPRRIIRELAISTVDAVAGRMAVTLQITDNSAERMIDNIDYFGDIAIDAIVIAPPFISLNATQDYLYDMYRQVIEASPCDVGIYHRNTPTAPNGETLSRLAELPKVVILKDSSGNVDDEKSILSTRDRLRATKDFYAYCGAEFDCPKAIQAGYDGMMIGGACFNGRMAGKIVELTRKGQIVEAKALQLRMNNLMYDVFGGKDIHCWLAGQKQLLVELGIFTTNKCVMNYQLDKETAENIKIAVKREEEFL